MDTNEGKRVDRPAGRPDQAAEEDRGAELGPHAKCVKPSEELGELVDCPTCALTTLEMTGYLRSSPPGKKPPHIQAHLDNCQACQSTWAFLEGIDPIVRSWDAERIAPIIREITGEESFAVGDREPLAPPDRAAAIQAVRGHLSSAGRTSTSVVADIVAEIKNTPVASVGQHVTPAFAARRIFEICDSVRNIELEAERFKAARLVGEAFSQIIRSAGKFGEYCEFIDSIFSAGDSLPLDDWKVLYVASLPPTSFLREPLLLDRDARNQPVFHAARFRQSMPDYQRAAMALDAPER